MGNVERTELMRMSLPPNDKKLALQEESLALILRMRAFQSYLRGLLPAIGMPK